MNSVNFIQCNSASNEFTGIHPANLSPELNPAMSHLIPWCPISGYTMNISAKFRCNQSNGYSSAGMDWS